MYYVLYTIHDSLNSSDVSNQTADEPGNSSESHQRRLRRHMVVAFIAAAAASRSRRVRMTALLIALLWVASAAAVGEASGTAAPRHVIFFLVDDYGFADASYKKALYPDKDLNPPPTPFFDQLAKAGVMLESYYVNKLCSPTRTALLSGRYAYTLGQDDGVIVDGTPNDLQLNLLTIADRLQQGGWNTSAYGKWDAGMTVWGSTPTCRGFQ